jgi:hypothetical protein
MYSVTNFQTKKALKLALTSAQAAGLDGISCYQPGIFSPIVADGPACCEGPHFPAPHTWYASCTVKGGLIIKVK